MQQCSPDASVLLQCKAPRALPVSNRPHQSKYLDPCRSTLSCLEAYRSNKKKGSCPTMAQRWRMWHELGVADHRFTGEGVICNEAAGQFSKALSATNPRLFLHICSIFGQGQGHLLLASAQTWLYMVPCNNYRVYGLWMVIVTRDSCMGKYIYIYTYIIIWYITFSWGYYGILPLFITILIINESLLIAIITTKSLLLRDGHLSIHRILWYID